jgi:Ribbon-helix-helix protein, copG family
MAREGPRLQVRLSPVEAEKLTRLAEKLTTTTSGVIRELLTVAYDRLIVRAGN